MKIENLLDNISDYQNSSKPRQRYPKEPGPPKIYINKHKARGAKTKGDVVRLYEKWVADGKKPKLDTSEMGTPLDETPAHILFGDND